MIISYRPKTAAKRVQENAIQRISENNINQAEELVYVTESKIDDQVQIAFPTKINKIEKPEVVYNPKTTTTTQTTSSTTISTTTTIKTTTTHDPIADHVNLLLQQYFSTITPDTEPDSVPQITYDDENNSVVMEYLSPDGDKSEVTDKFNDYKQVIAQEAATGLYNQAFQTPQTIVEPPSDMEIAFQPVPQEVLDDFEEEEAGAMFNQQFDTPQLPEVPPQDTLVAFEAVPDEVGMEAPNRPDLPSFFAEPNNPEKLLLPQLSKSGKFDNLLLPQPVAKFDRVFEPSSQPEDADWFVLDEQGIRQMDLNHFESPSAEENIDQPPIEKRISLSEVSDESGIESEIGISSTERETVGDFEPIIGPMQ